MDRFILEIPNFIPLRMCETIINEFKSIEHTLENGELKYTQPGNKIAIFKKPNKEAAMHNIPSLRDIESEMCSYVNRAFILYLKHLKCEFDHNKKPLPHTFTQVLNIEGVKDEGFAIQKIGRGSSYEWHTDSSPSNQGNHFLQMIIYLNTLKPNEGGTTEFANGRKVRPEAGKIVVFPLSWTFPHCGNEVKSDYKFITTILLSDIN